MSTNHQLAPETRNDILPDLLSRFEQLEALENPDQIVHLAQLRADEDLNIQIPGLGRFQMNDWARAQISTQLGIRFDKWFQSANPEDKAFELNRRFQRGQGDVKLRTTRMNTESTDGTLTAVVSPGFTPIKDSVIARIVLTALRGVESDLRITRSAVTTRSVSFVVGVGHPFIPGGDNAIGQIHGGVQIQNSGVGFCSLSMTIQMTRLACLNGLCVPVAGAELLRKRHTSGLNEDRIWKEVLTGFESIPGKLQQGARVLEHARTITLPDPQAAIARIIQMANLSKKLVPIFIEAFQKEAEPTPFSVVQAVTDSQTIAQNGITPEERLQLENAASQFLQNLQ